ncbi:MAG: GreA/GreB family elongation factor [Patescibacteria group bacterium]|nr:GreA/GreB family elongation factor [Patescibacteria group bacterium]
MQIPKRRYDKVYERPDINITDARFEELKNKLDKLKNVSRFKAMAEVARLAEMGDFSENHAYQMAKGRLRGINAKILEIEDYLNNVVIIKVDKADGLVKLGSTVTLETGGQQKIYQILGGTETDPVAGIISQQSPLGQALLGKHIGDRIEVCLPKRTVVYHIVDIS